MPLVGRSRVNFQQTNIMDDETSFHERHSALRTYSRSFVLLFFLALLLALTAITLISVLVTEDMGGFNWKDATKRFSYHPFFMIIGLVFLNGMSILVHRLSCPEKRLVNKLIHGGLQLCAAVFTALALYAVISYHQAIHASHFYSIHSWIGITAVFLFVCQYLCGFSIFLLPLADMPFRRLYRDVHVFFGLLVFVMVGVTVTTGLTNYSAMQSDYSTKNSKTYIINFIGGSVILFILTIIYLLVRERRPDPMATEEVVIVSNE